MTHDEIIRWFRRFKYDAEFRDENGSLMIRMVPLCEFVGLERSNVYHILARRKSLSEGYRNRLEYAIQCVQNGLRWRRKNCKYEIVGGGTWQSLPRYEYSRQIRSAE